jgi:hypothetical protein
MVLTRERPGYSAPQAVVFLVMDCGRTIGEWPVYLLSIMVSEEEASQEEVTVSVTTLLNKIRSWASALYSHELVAL